MQVVREGLAGLRLLIWLGGDGVLTALAIALALWASGFLGAVALGL